MAFESNAIPKQKIKIDRDKLRNAVSKSKQITQGSFEVEIKKSVSHCRQRCNPSPEISVGLGMFEADRFNFDHFLRLRPSSPDLRVQVPRSKSGYKPSEIV